MAHSSDTPPTQPNDPATWSHTVAAAALHASHELILALDQHGSIRYANPAALRALHNEAERVVGTSFIELLDHGSRAKGQRLLAQATTADTPAFELNQASADREIVTISYRALRVATFPDASTEDVAGMGWLLIGQPLAQTVATTERLIALNQRLSALFSIAATASRSLVLTELLSQALAVALSELDLHAGAIFLAETLHDHPRKESEPSAADRFELAVQQGFAPAFVARLSEPEQAHALWQGQAHSAATIAEMQGGATFVLQPEDLLHAAGPLLTAATVPLTSEGQLIGWLYVVTDRYRGLQNDQLDLLSTIGNLLGPPVANARLHDRLLQTSGQLQAVLNTIDSGVLLVDQQTIVRYANSRLGTLLNVDVSDWPGRPLATVMPSTLTLLMQPSPIFDSELWELAGPPRRILRRFAEQVEDAEGSPLGAIEVYSDVTQLQEMNRLKDEFVTAAAHDLKTPVTAVKGYAQIALRLARKLNDERLSQQLAMINARSDDLALLMDGLLDMSRIQAGRLLLEADSIAINTLIERVLNHFEFDLRRRKREVQVTMPEQPLVVVWDKLRMQGVLINVIGNALKYSPDGGVVLLGVHPLNDSEDWIELTVTDYGVGIPAEERTLIFDRFYRVRAAIEHGFKGTGIGLYIAQHVVELHGGRIWASNALHGGPGTTMHIEMPRVVVANPL